MKFVNRWTARLQHYGKRWWYSPLVGFFAFIDLFILVVPTDGILITAVMNAPKRWFYTAICVTIGSSVGAVVLAYLITLYGDQIIWTLFPHIHESKTWVWTEHLMNRYGTWAIFIIGLSPIIQHPVIILAALARVPLDALFFAMLAGRAIKYSFLSWVASHSPKLLNKLWGVKRELRTVATGSSKKPKK